LATEPESSRPRPQRAWRALCPNCGAPVEFASAASASAVCSFCRSTLLREGETLRRIGLSAELFDDHTPLQLGASGTYQGVPFTLVGRLQYRYADGTWNEWHALFEGSGDGTPRSGWLSEDNGALVLAFDQPPLADAPALDELHAGERRLLGGQGWSVASVVRASLIAAQGELPRPPRLEGEFTVVDLRNERDEVGTLDDADGPALQWSIGRSVTVAGLAMKGLREGVDASVKGQGLSCPNCGAALLPTLASTQSISCGQCKAVVDVSGGVGADLKAYAQNNSGAGGLEPQIKLGSTGRLALGAEGELDWQVVGFQERCDLPAPGDDDEQTFWREYLLYHRTAGFAFLVDADDGWSAVRPLTGAPQAQGSGATWQGVAYRKRYSYAATVTWVLGEFYWRVRRDERAMVTDYDGPGGAKLSREQTGNEVTWSAGKALDAKLVAQAFGVPLAQLRRDAAPLSGLGNSLGTLSTGKVGGLNQGLVIFAVVVVVMLLMARCDSSDDCSAQRQTFGESSAEYQQCQRNARSGGFRTGGGSFGGFSSGGGGHK
jgi:ribosomal protein S27AE